MTYRTVAIAVGITFLLSGCASLRDGRGALDDANMVCVLAGGLVGGAAGAVAANSNHGDDENDEAILGAAIGAVVGAVVGDYLCGPTTNAAPTVRISAEPRSGERPLAVSFRSVADDPDGSIAGYAWSFGDGGSSTEASPRHTYAEAGTYNATLTVTDDRGQTTSASTRIQVTAPAPPPVQRRIVLRGVNFALDSAQIRAVDQPILDVAVQVLKENSDISIEVAGHTDSTGSDAYNQGLSERRARSVVNYLARKGIAGSRLTPVGYGESRPVADNSTSDGRAQNRRVELSVR